MDVELRGKRALVVGLGIEGVDLVRYAVARGAEVIANDAKPRERLTESLAAIGALPVRYELGGHDERLAAGQDAILVSQGVPLGLPLIEAARRAGTPVLSLTGLFLTNCRGPVVGITGSSGKTTTTALLGEMFSRAGVRHIVGGNIGVPLLSRLDEIGPDTWVVLEVSHTQLELTDRSPHVATVTNVTPNHLDRYSWDAYVGLKRNLLAYQTADDIAVLNYDDRVARSFADWAAASVRYATAGGSLRGDGAYLRSGVVTLRRGGVETPVVPSADIQLRGAHNVQNVVCAVATADACGLPPQPAAAAVRAFAGVPHRLEVVGAVGGVTWVNDSIATTPERTLAALRSFDEPIVLLLGGREKKLPLDRLASEAARSCRAVICFGEARESLAAAMSPAGPTVVERLDQAVEAAAALARPGDVALLSPGCTSFDAYDNFERRGEAFRALVRALARGAGEGARS